MTSSSGLIFQPAASTFGHQLWIIAVFNLIAGYAASLMLGFFVLRGKRVRSPGASARFHPYLLALHLGSRLSRDLPTHQSAPLLGEDRARPDNEATQTKSAEPHSSQGVFRDVKAIMISRTPKPGARSHGKISRT